MTYVMVPVPEELVAEVQHYLRWSLVQPDVGSLDEHGAALFFESLDDEATRYLLVIADAAARSSALSTSEVAAAVGCSERTAVGLMAELNTSVQAFGTLPLGLVSRQKVDDPDAVSDDAGYTLTMRDDVAALLLSVQGPPDR